MTVVVHVPGCRMYHPTHQLSPDLRQQILERDHHRCQICNRRTAVAIDHIWPRRYGGTDHPYNLQASCQPCNTSKRDRVPPGLLPLFSATLGEYLTCCPGRPPRPHTAEIVGRLKPLADEVAYWEEQLAAELRARNAEVLACIHDKLPIAAIARAAGLSRTAVYDIRDASSRQENRDERH